MIVAFFMSNHLLVLHACAIHKTGLRKAVCGLVRFFLFSSIYDSLRESFPGFASLPKEAIRHPSRRHPTFTHITAQHSTPHIVRLLHVLQLLVCISISIS
jgi:hypothetical protein